MKIFNVALLCLALGGNSFAAPKNSVKTVTDISEAVKLSSYRLQGEYVSSKLGGPSLQVVALGNETYRCLTFSNGLPSVNELKPISIKEFKEKDLVKHLKSFIKVQRKSPTLGAKAPENAKLVFQGSNIGSGFKGELQNGVLMAGAVSNEAVGSFYMHLEFMLPYKPDRLPSDQDRGNSGIYIFNRYEVQVLDTFGLDLIESNNPGELKSEKERWCGSLYKSKAIDQNMAFPPLTWQTYEIDFTAPKFNAEGKKVSNAVISVRHNGVWVHKNVSLEKGTGNGGKKAEVAMEKIYLQNHGNPVQFRNIWVVEK